MDDPFLQNSVIATVIGSALVGVEDLGTAVPGERVFEGLDTELRTERVRQPPRQHGTAHPVHDHHQVEEALGHRDVGDRAVFLADLGRPAIDCQTACNRGSDSLSVQSAFMTAR